MPHLSLNITSTQISSYQLTSNNTQDKNETIDSNQGQSQENREGIRVFKGDFDFKFNMIVKFDLDSK